MNTLLNSWNKSANSSDKIQMEVTNQSSINISGVSFTGAVIYLDRTKDNEEEC